MTIDLPQELEERARSRVEAGEYSSVAQVVRAGLEALDALEADERAAALHDVAQHRWAEGDAAVARGDYFEGSPKEIMQRIRARVQTPV